MAKGVLVIQALEPYSYARITKEDGIMIPKRRTKASRMTPKEAKELYLAHKGSTLSMAMESSQKYNEFVMLRLKSKIIDGWDREIMLDAEQEIRNGSSAERWLAFGTYFDALMRIKGDYAELMDKFYELTDYAASEFDHMQRISVMELFGGMYGNLSEGIIKRITCKNFDKPKMLECIGRLTNFDPEFTLKTDAKETPEKRYLVALENIERAIELYFND